MNKNDAIEDLYRKLSSYIRVDRIAVDFDASMDLIFDDPTKENILSLATKIATPIDKNPKSLILTIEYIIREHLSI